MPLSAIAKVRLPLRFRCYFYLFLLFASVDLGFALNEFVYFLILVIRLAANRRLCHTHGRTRLLIIMALRNRLLNVIIYILII